MQEEIIQNFINTKISYSSISAFCYDRENWFKRYFLKEKIKETEIIKLGQKIDSDYKKNKIEIPKLKFENKNKEIQFDLPYLNLYGEKVPLKITGFLDGFEEINETKIKAMEMKTRLSTSRKWDQARVDKHKQITLYSLGLYLQDKIEPENQEWFFIEYVEKNKIPNILKTKRTKKECLEYAVDIISIHKQMISYLKLKLR